MAKRLDITTLIGKRMEGTELTILAAAGTDKFSHRLVRVACAACGSTDRIKRLGRIPRKEIKTCGCAEEAAFDAYVERGKNFLSKAKQLAVYEAVEQRVGYDKDATSVSVDVAAKFSLNLYVVHATWRTVRDRISRIMANDLEAVFAASHEARATIESLAARWAIPARVMKRVLYAAQNAAFEEAVATNMLEGWVLSRVNSAKIFMRRLRFVDSPEAISFRKLYEEAILRDDDSVLFEPSLPVVDMTDSDRATERHRHDIDWRDAALLPNGQYGDLISVLSSTPANAWGPAAKDDVDRLLHRAGKAQRYCRFAIAA